MSSTYPSPNALVTPNVTNASVQVATNNPQRLGLYVFNPSASVTLWVSPLGTPASATGVGSVAIQPGQGIFFGPPNMPSWTAGMNCIASSAGTNVVCCLEFYQ